MLVRPKGPKPKGFLGAAKSTDQLPYSIKVLEEIVPEGRECFPINQAGDIADFGPCYTRAQDEQIQQLSADGKIFKLFGYTNFFKVVGHVTSVSKAEELGIPTDSRIYIRD